VPNEEGRLWWLTTSIALAMGVGNHTNEFVELLTSLSIVVAESPKECAAIVAISAALGWLLKK